MDEIKIIEEFLIKNGFAKKGEKHFQNDYCEVIVLHRSPKDMPYYRVDTKEGSIYSSDLNIYWLVGLLTWNNYIPKNYYNI